MTFSLLGALYGLNFGIGKGFPSDGNVYGKPVWANFWWEGTLGREWQVWLRFHHFDAYTYGVDTVEGEEIAGDLTESIVCYQIGPRLRLSLGEGWRFGLAAGFSGNFYSGDRRVFGNYTHITQSTPGWVVRLQGARRKFFISKYRDWSVAVEVGGEAEFLYLKTRDVWPGPRWMAGAGLSIGVRW